MHAKRRLLRTRNLATPVGRSLETGKRDEEEGVRTRTLLRVGMLVALFVLTVLAFPRRQSYELSVPKGSVWNRNDLIAPFQFAVFKPSEVVDAQRTQARQQTPSVVRFRPDAMQRTRTNVDSLRAALGLVLTRYSDWQFDKQRRTDPGPSADSVAYWTLRSAFPVDLTERQWRYLLASHTARVPGLGTAVRTDVDQPALDEQILTAVVGTSEMLLEQRVLDVPTDSLPTERVIALDEENRLELTVDPEQLVGRTEARVAASESFADAFGMARDTVGIAMSFFEHAFVPNLAYLPVETAERIARSVSLILETRGSVQEGEVIIREGEIVTDEVARKIESLSIALSDRSGNFRLWRMLLGQGILTLACYMVLFFFIYLFRRDIWESTRDLSLVLMLLALFVAMFAAVVRVPTDQDPGLLVPVAMAPVLLTVIYDSRLAIVATVSIALLGGCILGFDFEFVALTIFAGTLATFSVRGIRTRTQFMITAGIVLLTYVITISVFQLFQVFNTQTYVRELVLLFGNATLLLLTLPVLWIFERLFRVTTDVTLLELSDTNQPLLRELSLRAAGSFSHSLQVANLAEAGADAIGANALLTRVGALYHDIGKMQKPEYFVENQSADFNPHDQLTPKMSALVIAAHVKDGIELAKRWRLPKVITDFIPMHHGTTRIEFFYRKALEQKDQQKEEVLETDFRYPGPRPRTKETGILMLADSVEAASKSVASSGKPTPKRFDALVDSIFRARLEDRQLDDCPLTFAELRRIRETFVTMLSSMYHYRVRYPGQEEEGSGERSLGEGSTSDSDTGDAPELDVDRRTSNERGEAPDATDGKSREAQASRED